jgi:hypothetical protein
VDYLVYADDYPNAEFAANFSPAWELTMARKDVRLMLEEGARHGVHYDVLPQIAKFFDRAIAAGHGAQDLGTVDAPDAVVSHRSRRRRARRIPSARAARPSGSPCVPPTARCWP